MQCISGEEVLQNRHREGHEKTLAELNHPTKVLFVIHRGKKSRTTREYSGREQGRGATAHHTSYALWPQVLAGIRPTRRPASSCAPLATLASQAASNHAGHGQQTES